MLRLMLPALLLLAGCGDRAATENEAIAVGRAYLAANPSGPSSTVEAIDMGNRWRLKFDDPDRGTGGPTIIVVNKRSGEVVHAETTQ